ncbi:MAG: AAA family ATPase, partial [Chloroflexi bacterium]|nr:AAA family ATPase [Chloroflexota bacterium]
ALDPLHEPAHRHLMRLYAWSDQRAAALRQYRECVRVLDQELGVSPLGDTAKLYEAIKENRKAEITSPNFQLPTLSPLIPNPPREATTRSGHPAYPLVGRSNEWTALLNAYDAIRADGHFVILEGEAGIGKTRLAEALLEHARSRGATTLAARCYAGEASLAYGPFIESLRAALGQPDRANALDAIPAHWLSDATRLLPELTSLRPDLPPTLPLEGPGAQSRFFESIRQLLLGLCRGLLPGLIFLDDLHWADEASLDLLTYLARRLRGHPLCFLATWRGDQVAASHRLRHLLADAQRAGTASLLPLSRLSQSAVQELARATLGALPAELGERLYRETEGLPFFLVEYLAMIGSGADANPSGQANWSLPGGVRDLLRSRLAAVDETGRQLLGAASVIGRSFDFETLREASGRSDEETVTALEALIARGIVVEVRGGDGAGAPTYDFSHEKLRAVAYEETSLARRRRLHRRAAEAIIARAARGSFVALGDPGLGRREVGAAASQIAQHYRLAGRDAEAADYFKLAGEHARALYANAEALAHFRSALALGHPATAALHEAIGDLQMLSGDYRAAATSYETAAALCRPEALAGVEHKLGNVHHRRGDWELAESHFQAALAAMGEQGSAGERARLYADWSLTTHHRGQTEEASRLATRALERAQAANDTLALAQAHNILGILASSRGNLEEARRHLQQSLALAETLDDPGARVASLNNLARVCSAGGDTERALILAETALALCVAQGDRHRRAALHNNLADLLHAAGQTEAAMLHLKQAVTLFAEIGVEVGDQQPEIWKLVEW